MTNSKDDHEKNLDLMKAELSALSPEDRLKFHLSFITTYFDEHAADCDFFITLGNRELGAGVSCTNLEHDESMALLGHILCQASGTEPITLTADDDPREVANKAATHIMNVHQSMQKGAS